MQRKGRVSLSQLDLVQGVESDFQSSSIASVALRTTERDRDPRRQLGAFYTPQNTAQLMANWLLRSSSDRVLEPSFGDGAFLSVLSEVAAAREWSEIEVTGVEIDQQPFEKAISRGLIAPERAIHADFLTVRPFPVDAVLGNPPYVRLRHLPADQGSRALRITEQLLGRRMESSGSLWMPFVLHASQFLRPGGRLALVLPYELTYVRYARSLWKYLAENFGHLTVVRAHNRLFPDLLQEAVVLFAEGKGRSTSFVNFKAFENIGDLGSDRPAVEKAISLDRLIAGERVFLEALLSEPLQDLLSTKIHDLTRPAGEHARFHIGYVSGDKNFFQPSSDSIAEYNLPSTSLIKAVTSTRKLKGVGLRTSELSKDCHEHLFLPSNAAKLTRGESKYIKHGEELQVDKRYKCRVRDPWFIVPWVRVPDLILSVFCELPLLMLNDAGFVASNSLLCGYLNDSSQAPNFAASWYTSLTALQSELQVHSLGGGVLVLVPRETGNIRVPQVRDVSANHINSLGGLLVANRLEDTYSLGDQTVLKKMCGLSSSEISLIQEGADALRHWRSGRS